MNVQESPRMLEKRVVIVAMNVAFSVFKKSRYINGEQRACKLLTEFNAISRPACRAMSCQNEGSTDQLSCFSLQLFLITLGLIR